MCIVGKEITPELERWCEDILSGTTFSPNFEKPYDVEKLHAYFIRGDAKGATGIHGQ
jgi:hypothetical protein